MPVLKGLHGDLSQETGRRREPQYSDTESALTSDAEDVISKEGGGVESLVDDSDIEEIALKKSSKASEKKAVGRGTEPRPDVPSEGKLSLSYGPRPLAR